MGLFGHDGPKTKVEVTVLRVTGIEGEDGPGKSDAFVELEIDDQEFRTQVVKNATDAEFNEHFVFEVDNINRRKLEIKLKDKDLIGSESICKAKVDLDDFPVGQTVEKEITLDRDLLSKNTRAYIKVLVHPSP